MSQPNIFDLLPSLPLVIPAPDRPFLTQRQIEDTLVLAVEDAKKLAIDPDASISDLRNALEHLFSFIHCHQAEVWDTLGPSPAYWRKVLLNYCKNGWERAGHWLTVLWPEEPLGHSPAPKKALNQLISASD